MCTLPLVLLSAVYLLSSLAISPDPGFFPLTEPLPTQRWPVTVEVVQDHLPRQVGNTPPMSKYSPCTSPPILTTGLPQAAVIACNLARRRRRRISEVRSGGEHVGLAPRAQPSYLCFQSQVLMRSRESATQPLHGVARDRQ